MRILNERRAAAEGSYVLMKKTNKCMKMGLLAAALLAGVMMGCSNVSNSGSGDSSGSGDGGQGGGGNSLKRFARKGRRSFSSNLRTGLQRRSRSWLKSSVGMRRSRSSAKRRNSMRRFCAGALRNLRHSPPDGNGAANS